jgi:hypothetical protein
VQAELGHVNHRGSGLVLGGSLAGLTQQNSGGQAGLVQGGLLQTVLGSLLASTDQCSAVNELLHYCCGMLCWLHRQQPAAAKCMIRSI